MRWIHLAQSPVIGDDKLKLPPYKFSKATLNDFAPWLELLTSSGVFDGSAPEIHKEMIPSMISGYIVRDKDKMIGCAALSYWSGFPAILYLYVDPAYRRQKIAWTLVNMCLLRAKANDIHQVRVHIPETKIPALELFKKLGFKEYIEHPGLEASQLNLI